MGGIALLSGIAPDGSICFMDYETHNKNIKIKILEGAMNHSVLIILKFGKKKDLKPGDLDPHFWQIDAATAKLLYGRWQ